MSADHHHPRSINLQAKSKKFNFKFKATKILPACYNFFQFSIFLNISSLIIRVSSDNYTQPARRNSFKTKIKRFIERFPIIPTKRITGSARRKSFKTKIKRFIKRFRIIPIKKKTGSVHKSSGVKKSKSISCEGPVCGCNVVIGKLAMLIRTLLKTFMRIKNNKLVLISVLLLVGYPLGLYMMNSSIHGRIIFGWRCIRKIWNWGIGLKL